MTSRTAFLAGGALAIVTAAGCTTEDTTSMFIATPAMTSSFAMSVDPASFALVPVSAFGTTSCAGFATSFDLIVQNTGSSDLFLEEATIRLIDGTTLGGPMVPVPSSDLSRRFGTVVIRHGKTRRFRFHDRFGCGLKRPRTVRIDAHFTGAGGGTSFATIDVPSA